MASKLNIMDILEHDTNMADSVKRLFQAAVDYSFNSVVITTAAAGYPIVYVNEAFTELTGYAAEEVIGQSPRLLQGPNTDRSVLERLEEDLKAGRPFHGEAVNYRKDGTEFIMEWKIAPVKGENGIATHFVAIQRDVSHFSPAKKL